MVQMYVIKRDGKKQPISFDKIHSRINYLAENPIILKNVNSSALSQLVIQGLIDSIKTSQIDEHSARLADALQTKHYEYNILASRIAINNHHKNTLHSFSDKMYKLYLNKDKNGNHAPIIKEDFNKFIYIHKNQLNNAIDYDRDYLYTYFGFRTMIDGYLLRLSDEDNTIIERPQDLIMRVAIQIHMPQSKVEFRNASLNKIIKTYNEMSLHYYTHATPTLFNSGTKEANLSSCFLLNVDDSLDSIMKVAWDTANISKLSGGVGFHIGNIRSEDSLIRGTNGKSKGVVPFLKIYNAIARAFDQGGGKRKGSFAPYMELSHPDIINFLKLKLNQGDENMRCRDLFIALWIPDLFMKRLEKTQTNKAVKQMWSVFCPDECPGLNDTFGDEYEELYLKYEREGKATNTYDVMEIMIAIKKSQTESGIPYMLYKDNVNRASMQNNVGTIKCSNLCTEIVLFTSANESAVCNLSSICLPKFVEDSYTEDEKTQSEDLRRKLDHEFPINPKMNWKKLAEIAGDITENLNNVIDVTFNPIVEAARSNFKHRPIGIGVQGLADVFLKFGVPFESDKARELNKKISEAIYYGALSKSTELCRDIYHKILKSDASDFVYKLYVQHTLDKYPELEKENILEVYTNKKDIPKTIGSYPSYTKNGGSHLYNGKFHWELYGLEAKDLSGLFDWESLRSHIKIFGVRNSLTTAYMPTGTTSNIMGCNPAFEPYVNNVFTRTTLAGKYTIMNKYLIKYLQDANMYDDKFNTYLKDNNGSIQNIEGIPENIKNLYKTAWEIKQKNIMQLAIDRQPFIDQSQSMNIWFEDFTLNKFISAQFVAWRGKLKTGVYYTRTREAVMPQKFTISAESAKELSLLETINANKINSNNEEPEEEICLMCSA